MDHLRRRISERNSEFLLFAVTPPRQTTSPERAQQIADATLDRLRPLALDGLVLYDIDDESDRNPEKRPFVTDRAHPDGEVTRLVERRPRRATNPHHPALPPVARSPVSGPSGDAGARTSPRTQPVSRCSVLR